MARSERPAGQYDPVRSRRCQRRSLWFPGLARGDRASGRRGSQRHRLSRSHRAQAGPPRTRSGVSRTHCWVPCWCWSRRRRRESQCEDSSFRSEARAGPSKLTSCWTSERPRSRWREAIPSRWVSKSVAGDKIPESARATYHFADGEEASEPLRSMEGGEFRGRIESVNQPFRFTVTAGDDLTSIRDVAVKVVPPPTLKSLAIRVVSPAVHGLGIPGPRPGTDPAPRPGGNPARARGGREQTPGPRRAAPWRQAGRRHPWLSTKPELDSRRP